MRTSHGIITTPGFYMPMEYAYDSPGTKTIKIYGNNKGYQLGYNSTYQIVKPAGYVVDVNLAWDLATITQYMFSGTKLTKAPLTDYIIEIGDGAFQDCTELEILELPRSLQKIGLGAFLNCSKLSGTLKVPSKLSVIGKNAFNSCISLEGIDFTAAQNLIAIEDSAFRICSKLEYIDLPASIATLGTGCFAACKNLSKVIIRNPNLVIGEGGAFYSCPELKSAGPIGSLTRDDYFVDIEYAWTQTIPAYAFSQVNLTEIILPNDLKVISRNAFQYTQITNIDLPYGLTTIEDKAFIYSTLQQVSIPATVQNLGIQIFSYCRSLYDIQLYMPGISTDSKEKLKEPMNSWFYQSNPDAKITVPYSIFNEESGIIPGDVFGAYWNLYDIKGGDDDGHRMIEYTQRTP
jgi:hypothetical protein